MFFSSPSLDVKIIVVLLVISFLISLAVYFFSRIILLGVVIFSLLGNGIVYFGIDFNLANIYKLNSLFYFSRNIWPYINIALLVLLAFKYARNLYIKR